MSNTIIKVENLSKQYRLGQVGTGSLSHDVNRWWHTVRGKEDPYLKISEENDRTSKGGSDYVWALRDINFEVKQGEVLGIIGRNGAGKSTLLKILSKTTTPTTGNIKIKGRIASLLEVGTGFHPELSGRDNIFLNGAILGMTKEEIKKKFDEILDFAGVEKYVDTPVKRYSSGMYVRLAFAVAAHLEPEILIVDEVLAVGDAEFQKKALGKMKDVSDKDGRTVIYVSHQLATVAKLCQRAVLMENGQFLLDGEASTVINHYLTKSKGSGTHYLSPSSNSDKQAFFREINLVNAQNQNVEEIGFNEKMIIRLKITVNEFVKNTLIGIGLADKFGTRVCTIFKPLEEFYDKASSLIDLTIQLPSGIIAPNQYNFTFALSIPNREPIEVLENICPIRIIDTGTEFSIFEGMDYGSFMINAEWKYCASSYEP